MVHFREERKKVGREEEGNVQPVEFTIVSEAEDEFVYDAVDCDGPARKLESCVCRVVEDEIVSVEVCQWAAAHASCELHGHRK